MMTTDLYRSQHAQIMLLLIQLDAQLPQSLSDKAAEGRRILARLDDRLAAHSAAEDSLLYPRLLSCPDPATRALAESFESEMDRMAHEFRRFTRRWLPDGAIEARPADFIRETHAIVPPLIERIRRENAQLLPLADQVTGRSRLAGPRSLRRPASSLLSALTLASNA
jgi:hypothetical protein